MKPTAKDRAKSSVIALKEAAEILLDNWDSVNIESATLPSEIDFPNTHLAWQLVRSVEELPDIPPQRK